MGEPFVKLARKFFRHWLWTERRELSRAEAWIDMITTATYEDEASFTEGGCLITLRRAEMRASVRELGTRWGWSRSKVERYLLLLKKERMIETRTSAGLNIIKLSNYELYHPPRDSDEHQNGTTARHARDTGETPPDGFPLCTLPSFPPQGEKKGKKVKKLSAASELTFPDRINTPLCIQAVEKWIAYRSDIKKPLMIKSMQAQLERLAQYGPDVTRLAIEESIANQYQGLFPEKIATQQPKPKNGIPLKQNEMPLIWDPLKLQK